MPIMAKLRVHRHSPVVCVSETALSACVHWECLRKTSEEPKVKGRDAGPPVKRIHRCGSRASKKINQQEGSMGIGKGYFKALISGLSWIRSVAIFTALGGIGLFLVAFSTLDRGAPGAGKAEVDFSGWGAEILHAHPAAPPSFSIIAPANACGLGASSCFRCHNGRRAAEPPADPWHTDHARVNNSCVGCHQGNPRLMREAMAHADLLADPRSTPEASCSSCHRNDGERSAYLARYLGQ